MTYFKAHVLIAVVIFGFAATPIRFMLEGRPKEMVLGLGMALIAAMVFCLGAMVSKFPFKDQSELKRYVVRFSIAIIAVALFQIVYLIWP